MIKLLDLYCGAGGCSKGYAQALDELGIEYVIIGVDLYPQPNYPYEFIQCDALEYLKAKGNIFDFYHASPPCQRYSRTVSLHKRKHTYPDLIAPTRQLLIATGKPYTIENVPGSPLIMPLQLDGTMFGLRVIRKRLFESNALQWIDTIPKKKKVGTVGGKNFTRKSPGHYFIVGGHQSGTIAEWRAAMGIDWMNKKALAQAIPPAYTHYIGKTIFPKLFNK